MHYKNEGNSHQNNGQKSVNNKAKEGQKCMKFNPFIPDEENPYNNLNKEIGEEISQEELTDDDFIVLCYNCKKPIVIQDNWNIFECSSCHKLNKLPRKLINELYFEDKLKNVYYNNYINHLETIVPTAFLIVNCPFCKGSNKVRKEAVHCKCFFCEKGFNVDKSEELVRPLEQVSLDPNSKFYRYKENKGEVKRVYPPNKVYRVPEFWFPEPLDYHNDFYYNPINMHKIYFNDFKWDKNTHELTFVDPFTSNIPNVPEGESSQNKVTLRENYPAPDIEELKRNVERKKEEKNRLYNSLFFMK